MHVFVDEDGIAVPHTNRALYVLLEDCVHSVRALGGQVLRTLIKGPERLAASLRALLGGADGLADWMTNDGSSAWQGDSAAGLGGDTLLEELVRTTAR